MSYAHSSFNTLRDCAPVCWGMDLLVSYCESGRDKEIVREDRVQNEKEYFSSTCPDVW